MLKLTSYFIEKSKLFLFFPNLKRLESDCVSQLNNSSTGKPFMNKKKKKQGFFFFKEWIFTSDFA